VLGAFDPPADSTWAKDVPADPLGGGPAAHMLVVRVQIDPSARESTNLWILPATHFRLVTSDPEDDSIRHTHYPVAYLTARTDLKDKGNIVKATAIDWQAVGAPKDGEVAQVARLCVTRDTGGPTGLVVDWVFRIEDKQKPVNLVFRRSSTATVPQPKPGLPSDDKALSRLLDAPPPKP
jgi:hypothetical protein